MSDPVSVPDPTQHDFAERIELAEKMVPLIGHLRRNRNVVTSVFGRLLQNVTETDIVKFHRYGRRITNKDLSLKQTLPVLEQLVEMNLGTASIDIGALAIGFDEQGGGDEKALRAYLESELAEVIGSSQETPQTDVVLYGFGRIGRLLARILIARHAAFNGPRLRAIVVRKKSDDDIYKRASLLRRDSVHGAFEGTISVDPEKNIIWANGFPIQVIYADAPESIDYIAYGINDAIVVDNTGAWRDRAGLSRHTAAKGVVKALLTAPGKGDVKNIVYGVNQDMIEDSDEILSAASCTTNGITPVLDVIERKWGVRHGHVEAVHSFTNDQNLIDNFHKGERRGRAATLNLVLTETGAAKAVAKALPSFEGKLTGNSIRVPTPDVSMAVLNLTLEKPAERDEVNDYLRRVSLTSVLRQQIDYIQSPDVVSTDFVGTTHAGIVDGGATIADGENLVLYVWYDNEFGYSHQVIRVLERMAGARPKVLPQRKQLDEV